MRVFPSIPAAICTGAIVMPLLLWGYRFIERTFQNQALLFLWVIIAFFIPVLFSTADMRYLMRRWRAGGFFRDLMSREDFQQFYIPAWIRMAVLFVSTIVAVIVLSILGLGL